MSARFSFRDEIVACDRAFDTCVCRKLDSAILMVKATEDGLCDDGAEALNRAM